MNSVLADNRARYFVPLVFGAWAAAIALAPDFRSKALLAAPALLTPLAFWTLHKPALWLTLFFAAALVLPPLPIAIGDSGPHPSLILAAVGVFAGLLWLPDWRIAGSGLGAAFTALFGVMLASVALAAFRSGLQPAAGSLARVILFGISVYVFFYTAYGPGKGQSTGNPSVRFLYWMAAASALFACVDFYFQFPAPAGYGPQFVWMETGVFRRAQGFFYEASTLGNFCAFFLVMIAVAFTRPRAESPVSRKALLAGGRGILCGLGAVVFAGLTFEFAGSDDGAGVAQPAAGAAGQGGGGAVCRDAAGLAHLSELCGDVLAAAFQHSTIFLHGHGGRALSDVWRVGRHWPGGLPRTPGRRCWESGIRRCPIATIWGGRWWPTTCI